MLNKKKVLGAGLIIIGGAVAGIGGIILKKSFTKTDTSSHSACGEVECNDCGYCEHYMNEDNFKEDLYKVEPKELEEESFIVATEVVETASVYNPLNEPKSISQEDLEAHGCSTF